MAAGSAARIIHAPGRLVVDPSGNLDSGSFPYNGTEIGKTNAVFLVPLGTSFNVEYESLGEIGDVLEADNRYVFACFIRGWDDDAVAQCLAAGAETGAITQHAVYHEPGNKTPGQSALARARILLYVPDDPIHVPACLIYRGVPDWSEGAELAFQRGSELGIPLAVECLRDSNDNILRVGRINDLSLT